MLYTLCFNKTLSLLKQLALCSKSNFIAHCITAAKVFCGPVEIAMASNEKKTMIILSHINIGMVQEKY